MKKIIGYFRIALIILFLPGSVFSGSFGIISLQSDTILLQLGLNTGSMDNPEDEEEEIEQWKSMYTPIAEKLLTALDARIEQFADKYPGFPFIAYDDELDELWEESVKSSDIPDFLEEGNRPCTYVIRVTPLFPCDMTLIKVSFSCLPEREDREQLKFYLETSIENF